MQQSRAATHVQTYLRVLCAKHRVRGLIAGVIARARGYVAVRLQAEYRRWKGRQEYERVKREASAVTIQKHMRRRIAGRAVRGKMGYRAKVVRIQRFVKRWCKRKRQMTIVIQARLRQVRAKKKVTKFLSITRGS